MRILLYNPDNGVTRNFMPHLWMFLLQALTPSGHEVLLIDGNAQPMAGMPEGPVKADAPKVVLPDREKMKTQMEALIYHFKIITEGFTVPAGEVYQAIESPRGEMGYYVVSDGTAKPYRVHMRGPSYANLQTLAKMCEGQLIADVVAAIGSIDVVLGDIDR